MNDPAVLREKKIVVVMPAYNAARTVTVTCEEVLAQGVVDEIILVDDASTDGTEQVACRLPQVTVIEYPKNRGYGGNQKTCYCLAKWGLRRSKRFPAHLRTIFLQRRSQSARSNFVPRQRP